MILTDHAVVADLAVVNDLAVDQKIHMETATVHAVARVETDSEVGRATYVFYQETGSVVSGSL